MFFPPCGIVYISVHSFTNVWFGGGTEYSLTLTETDDISTGMFMVYGSQVYMEEDIQNYSPTAMFRGTPCTLTGSGGRQAAMSHNCSYPFHATY